PRCSQVGKLRALVLTLLDRARKLRSGQHGDIQLPGKLLELARDKANLLHAVLHAPATGIHQLQIVHHDQVQTVLAVQAAALGPHLDRRLRRRVVEENADVAQVASRLNKERPLAVVEFAEAQVLRADARLGRDETLHDLLVAHLHAEDSDARAGAGRV